MEKWNGKRKALTFSYDDGVVSDKRLLELFNRYGLKATFNLNSGLLGTDHTWVCGDFEVARLPLENLRELYAGHEIAAHGKLHLHPTELSLEELKQEMEEDKAALEKMFEKPVCGMAYSFGEYNDQVIQVLENAGIQYARTVESTHSFAPQTSLLAFHPTCHHNDPEIFRLIQAFLDSDDDQPRLFYIWGHAYEFDAGRNWEHMEKICEMLSGRDDVFYGTNSQVLLDTPV